MQSEDMKYLTSKYLRPKLNVTINGTFLLEIPSLDQCK